jgi:RNA recognition motif-containing protein
MDGVLEKNGSHSKMPNTNLYVARLPEWVTDDWLRMEFEKFGMIVSCKVLNEGPSGPRGVGFVQYTTPEMAMNALKAMNRTYIGNNCINVRFAHRDKDKGVQNQPSNNIYVCNLPKFFGEAELYALFSPHGAITSLIVLEDRKTGQSKCAGLIRFLNLEDSKSAVNALNGLVLNNYDRPLEVKFAENTQAKEQRLERSKEHEKKRTVRGNQDAPRANDAQNPSQATNKRQQGRSTEAAPRGVDKGFVKDQQKGKAGRNARDTRGPTEQASAKLQAKNAPKVKGHENGWTAPAAQKHQLDTEDLKRIFRSVPPSSAPPADTILGSLGHDFQLPVPRMFADAAIEDEIHTITDEASTDDNKADCSSASDTSSPDPVDSSAAVNAFDMWANATMPPKGGARVSQNSLNSLSDNDSWAPSTASTTHLDTEGLFAPFRAMMGKVGDGSPILSSCGGSDHGQPSPIASPLLLDNVPSAAMLLPFSL